MHHTVSLQLMTMNERPQQRKNEMHEQEPHPASQFTENAAAFFFSDDKELAGLFTDRLMTGHCADPVRLETAMQERGVSACTNYSLTAINHSHHTAQSTLQ